MFNLIPFASAILVSMRLSGEFLMLCTTDKIHGRSQRFLTNAARLREWLKNNDGSTLIDNDLSNYLMIYRFNADKVTMRFTWLSSPNNLGDLHGYQQTMILPVEQLQKALIGFKTKVLTDPGLVPQSRLVFSESGQAQIGKIIRDKKAKRALCKVLRDSFHWRDTDEVYIVADWHGFYFTTPGMNGGIIQHERTKRRKDGKEHREVWYQIHT